MSTDKKSLDLVINKFRTKEDYEKNREVIGENELVVVEEDDLDIKRIFGLEYGGRLDLGGKKEVGKIYYYPTTGKCYKCLKENTSTSPSTDNFSPLSLSDNDDRLDNLIKISQRNQNTDVEIGNVFITFGVKYGTIANMPFEVITPSARHLVKSISCTMSSGGVNADKKSDTTVSITPNISNNTVYYILVGIIL